ncbi:hypothetical protein MUN89_05655 [Halobacillus salinarum]|uniref:Uncharacterized protein n=1 Tax=Halobacillus salinarum TaxID=2932257 RepID=A0ABY4ENA9_9BACI|nr:hypothetical protein [Halobacillus salinarum]UOQ45432.1 hypothetical protein MUN89_05655 [Halobacillus salinarum]
MGDLIPFPRKDTEEEILLTQVEFEELERLKAQMRTEKRLLPFWRISRRIKKIIKIGKERAVRKK